MKILSVIAFAIVMLTSPQQAKYYLYRNTTGGFEFMCPSTWVFKPDTLTNDTGGYLAINSLRGKFLPTDPTETDFYNDCYEGVVFYVEIIEKPLENALLDNHMYYKQKGDFYTNYGFMTTDSVETEAISGIGWKGIHHINTCRIHCKTDDVNPVVEGCQELYFSNGKRTINFSTSGHVLESEVYEMIQSTFRFID